MNISPSKQASWYGKSKNSKIVVNAPELLATFTTLKTVLTLKATSATVASNWRS